MIFRNLAVNQIVNNCDFITCGLIDLNEKKLDSYFINHFVWYSVVIVDNFVVLNMKKKHSIKICVIICC